MKFHMKKKPSQKQKYCQKMFPWPFWNMENSFDFSALFCSNNL
jgi:hypothetical protein